MEIDTRVAVSVVPEESLSSLLPSLEWRRTNVILRTYTGQSIPVKGSVLVSVKYKQQLFRNMELLIVEGSGPSLMGQDWLEVIKLDWKSIGQIESSEDMTESQVSALKCKYSEVFSEALGTISPFRATLSVTTDAKPKFCKPRSVPLALKERVEKELERLQQEGVLEKVNYSEWAAPIFGYVVITK